MRLTPALALAIVVSAAACNGPTQPSRTTTTTSISPGIVAVVITGLEGPGTLVLPTESLRLRATATYADRHVEDCTRSASWDSTNSDVRITAGEIHALPRGEWQVLATCGGVTGRVTVKVAAYRLRVTVRHNGRPVPGARVMDALGNFGTADDEGVFEWEAVRRNFSLTIGKIGYDTKSVDVAWNKEPAMDLSVELPAASGTTLVQEERELCAYVEGREQYCPAAGAPARLEYEFRLPRAGVLRVRTMWFLDEDDFVTLELHCDESLVTTVRQQQRSFAQGFDVPARMGCQYGLSVTAEGRHPVMTIGVSASVVP
jgi:hypothetical protein